MNINLKSYQYSLKNLIRFVITISCIVYIITFFLQNKKDFKIILSASPGYLIAMTALFVTGHIIYSFRFKIVLEKCSNSPLPFWSWFKIFILGRFLGTFASQTGNIYKSISLKKNFAVSYTRYASSLFSFAWLDTCFNLLYAMAIVLMVKADLRIANFKALNLLLLLIAVIATAPLLLEFGFRQLNFRNRYLSWLHEKLSEMLKVSVSSLSDPTYIFKIVLTGIIALINAVALFYLCFKSLAINVTLPSLALFYVVLKLSAQIIITPGNLGVRELAFGILSDQMNIGMAQGLIVSAIIRILGTSVIIALGTFFGGINLLHHRKDYSKFAE